MDAPKKRLLYLSSVWPEPRSSAAGVRTQQILETFQSDPTTRWEICFVSPGQESRHSRSLVKQGIEIEQIPPNDSALQAKVMTFKPDVVIYDRFIVEEQYGWRVREAWPQAFEILDTQDLHSLRRNRGAKLQDQKEDQKVIARELASILRCHWTWVVSEFERKLLIETYAIPEAMVTELPFAPVGQLESHLSFQFRKNIAFIGNYRHEPNREGILWFVEEVWPDIRRNHPDQELHLYGAYVPREITELEKSISGVRVKGWCESVGEVLSGYLMTIAPLRFGAGIKGKIIESWNVGTPVLGTLVAFEGMKVQGELEELVIKEKEDWDRVISTLLIDPSSWKRLSRGARDHVKAYYSLAEIQTKVLKGLNERLNESPQFKNWYRDVLLMESFERTKYFSKWIELKNESRDSTSP